MAEGNGPDSGNVALLVAAGFLVFSLILFFGLFGASQEKDSVAGPTIAGAGELSSAVPPVYAALFKEAAGYFKVSPAIIAGIYLTEHHTDSFGKDLDLPSARMTGSCDTSSAGAKGPSQIMPSEWENFVKNYAPKIGIIDPDICRYRDSFFASAMVIKIKLREQPDTRRDCNIDETGQNGWTDDCVRSMGRAYCGACTGPACGTKGYNYCEQTLKHFKIASGSLAYLPSLLIESKKELACITKGY